MSYLVFGGFTNTEGICAKTRAANIDVLERIARPDRINVEDENSRYHSQKTLELLDEAQWWRDNALLEDQRLPKIREAVNTLFRRALGEQRAQAAARVPSARARPGPGPPAGPGRDRSVPGRHHAQREPCPSAASTRTATTTPRRFPSLERLFRATDIFLDEAEAQGCAQDVVPRDGVGLRSHPGVQRR